MFHYGPGNGKTIQHGSTTAFEKKIQNQALYSKYFNQIPDIERTYCTCDTRASHRMIIDYFALRQKTEKKKFFREELAGLYVVNVITKELSVEVTCSQKMNSIQPDIW